MPLLAHTLTGRALQRQYSDVLLLQQSDVLAQAPVCAAPACHLTISLLQLLALHRDSDTPLRHTCSMLLLIKQHRACRLPAFCMEKGDVAGLQVLRP